MPIDEAKLKEVETAVLETGVCLAESETNGGVGGWEGGTVWLVPTYRSRSVEDWKPIATRTL